MGAHFPPLLRVSSHPQSAGGKGRTWREVVAGGGRVLETAVARAAVASMNREADSAADSAAVPEGIVSHMRAELAAAKVRQTGSVLAVVSFGHEWCCRCTRRHCQDYVITLTSAAAIRCC